MQARPFEATVRQRPGVTIADLHGDVNRDAATGLTEIYEAAAVAGAATILLNFDDVDFINSTGIAVIVGMLARARTDRRTLVVCGLSEHYRSIFEITRLIDYMQVFQDEEAALSSSATASTLGGTTG